MSVSSKKRRQHESWEESLGGCLPSIAIDDAHEGIWLMWLYHVAPWELRVEIRLDAGQAPWLYVNGNDTELYNEKSQARAEAQYGAMTRIHLMQRFVDAIRANQKDGLAQLEEAAKAAGLYGKREPRHCIVTTWTTT